MKVFTSSLFNSYTVRIPKWKRKVNNWRESRFEILVIQGLFANFEKRKSCGEKGVWLCRVLEPGCLCNDSRCKAAPLAKGWTRERERERKLIWMIRLSAGKRISFWKFITQVYPDVCLVLNNHHLCCPETLILKSTNLSVIIINRNWLKITVKDKNMILLDSKMQPICNL